MAAYYVDNKRDISNTKRINKENNTQYVRLGCYHFIR